MEPERILLRTRQPSCALPPSKKNIMFRGADTTAGDIIIIIIISDIIIVIIVSSSSSSISAGYHQQDIILSYTDS